MRAVLQYISLGWQLDTRCCSHQFNLVDSGPSQVPSIRNKWILLQRFVFLFRCLCSYSAKVHPNGNTVTSSKKKTFVTLCKSRWAERHDSIITFCFIKFSPLQQNLGCATVTNSVDVLTLAITCSAIPTKRNFLDATLCSVVREERTL